MGFVDHYIETLRECGREDDANRIEEEEYGIFKNKKGFKEYMQETKNIIKGENNYGNKM